MACLDDDYSWSPPSEAELKVIEARRERNNKISSIMGQYLLKGYKMLAITCPVCECILLEDRIQNKYCIGCSEVDADTWKDNPAVSEEAARRAVEEIQHRQNHDKDTSPPPGMAVASQQTSSINNAAIY
ncbi:protein ZNRD2 isoform X2 [Procambarus clarkii]